MIEVYLTTWCPYCQRARALLDSKEASYTVIDVDADPSKREDMTSRGGGRTVPQIFIANNAIGGCDDLYALERNGKLDPLLAAL